MPLQQVHPESVMDKKAQERTTEMRQRLPFDFWPGLVFFLTG
jgi:hypothetical protein